MSSAGDLRRLMQLKKANSKQQVSHPLAKYNNLGQLSCVICTKVIKDESVWNAHLQSKRHKDNVIQLKTNSAASKSMPPPKKIDSGSSKISTKSQLPNDFFDQKNGDSSNKNIIPSSSNNSKPKSILKGSNDYKKQYGMPVVQKNIETKKLASSNSSTSNQISSKNEMEVDKPPVVDKTDVNDRKRKLNANLPSDFFDEPKKEKKEDDETKTTEKKESTTSSDSNLPEGFFDDPKKDAEARNVEYKDPKEAEWEMFQKMIEEETKVAETIQEEEDEESEMHKDMTEYNKMKKCLSRVEHLKQLVTKEKMMKKKSSDASKSSETMDHEMSGGSDDEDVDSMFDWRAKTF